jgi:hypothetical protein
MTRTRRIRRIAGIAEKLMAAPNEERQMLGPQDAAEERLLEASDACYQGYRARVPCRFVPFVGSRGGV